MSDEPMVTPEAKAMIGQEVGRNSGVVYQKEAQRWAAAVGDLNPRYLDAEAAKAQGFRDTPIPPLFLSQVMQGVTLRNTLRPDGIPWVFDPSSSVNPVENKKLADRSAIGIEELARHFHSGTARFVDARSAEVFARGHLAGALNIPADDLDSAAVEQRVRLMLPREEPVIIYCTGVACEDSGHVFEYLVKRHGFSKDKLRIFRPGWAALHARADLPKAAGTDECTAYVRSPSRRAARPWRFWWARLSCCWPRQRSLTRPYLRGTSRGISCCRLPW